MPFIMQLHVTLSQYWCTLWRAIMFSCKCRQLSGSCLLICWQVDDGRYCSVELFTCYSFGKWLLPLSEFHNAPGQLKDCAHSHIFVGTNLTCSFRTQLNQSRYLGTDWPNVWQGLLNNVVVRVWICTVMSSVVKLTCSIQNPTTNIFRRWAMSYEWLSATHASFSPLHSASHTSLTLSSVQPHECM